MPLAGDGFTVVSAMRHTHPKALTLVLSGYPALGPSPESDHAVTLLEHGTLKVKLSLPVRPTVQTPHTQDELYIIVRGRGVLVHDGTRDPFKAGDLLFVAAGTEHQIENFTDLALWVVFYGVTGGEVAA
jgi:mannose-6-phosphate isomerase-like protein (cupin superfamily)